MSLMANNQTWETNNWRRSVLSSCAPTAQAPRRTSKTGRPTLLGMQSRCLMTNTYLPYIHTCSLFYREQLAFMFHKTM